MSLVQHIIDEIHEITQNEIDAIHVEIHRITERDIEGIESEAMTKKERREYRRIKKAIKNTEKGIHGAIWNTQRT